MAIKVTFYNDVNFEQNAKVDKSVYNASINPDSGSFSDGGIYFTPLQNITNPEKEEFYLPAVVDKLIKEEGENVKVIPTSEKWYGVTYKEDAGAVSDALKNKIDKK